MAGDLIREALQLLNEAWAAVEDGDYGLPPDAKNAAKRELDDAIESAEEAARIALAEPLS